MQSIDVLDCWQIGNVQFKEFVRKRIVDQVIPFHSPIKKCKIVFFNDTAKCTTITSGNKTAVIQANRNVLSKLLIISTKHEKSVDFEKALAYPLTITPLSLSNPDGTRRTTKKSKLAEVLSAFQEDKNSKTTDIAKDADVYVVDFIAQIIVISKNLPETYEQLAISFLRSIPKDYNRVDIIADTYRNDSIKNAERNLRGTSSKIVVKSVKSKIPRNFSSFMMNNENKTQLTKIIFDFIMHNNVRCLDILQTNEVLLSGDGECHNVYSVTFRTSL